ncbi:pyridoxamine 5'-phosphate oxidase family protein [Actinomycetospora termitidis]|uniref:Pyridoxamine 5'-phosphate oxidase family protein n=1 Tax=Actinomycetospora termitidis TaxID=3053470 RepID=A0ABT7MAY5_9PSEU|nr:pyridoxamine 5'-phosphate oxidase family protein [Actinomycetospora sp. Odt1-22]MDL5157820.1 pyridoxamine 5'-phosphate oxidase family protein [Actinomycetospora sp. Odt1-22]
MTETDTEIDAAIDAGTDEALPAGPLHGDVLHRVVAARTAVLATSDRDGRTDVHVLSGPRCFLRVLDAGRFAFPDEGVEPTSAARGNIVESPRVGMLLVDDAGPRRRGLHVDGTARVVPDAELRAEFADLPTHPVPGRDTDVWVVVEVGDLYPLDGADVPPLGPGAAPVAAAPTGGGRRPVLIAAVLGLVAALLAVAVVALVATRPDASAAAPPPAAPAPDPGPTGPPTLRGVVDRVVDPATLVVTVAGRPVTVAVVGLDAATVPPCALPESLDFARRTLGGQTVTLVPDPTLPTRPGVTRAYAVLGSQLSYTDAAISGGHAPAAGDAQYRAVFDREQRDARADGVGMWGPPCVR